LNHPRDITSAAGHLTDTYNKLRWPVLKHVTILLVATIVIHLGFGTFIFWGNPDAAQYELAGIDRAQRAAEAGDAGAAG